MITIDDFNQLDIRIGTIIDATTFEGARKPAIKLLIDFGPEIGTKKSSAQITDLYTTNELIGKKILGVVNLPPRQIANYISEVLVLGTYSKNGVILITSDKLGLVENGDKLG